MKKVFVFSLLFLLLGSLLVSASFSDWVSGKVSFGKVSFFGKQPVPAVQPVTEPAQGCQVWDGIRPGDSVPYPGNPNSGSGAATTSDAGTKVTLEALAQNTAAVSIMGITQTISQNNLRFFSNAGIYVGVTNINMETSYNTYTYEGVRPPTATRIIGSATLIIGNKDCVAQKLKTPAQEPATTPKSCSTALCISEKLFHIKRVLPYSKAGSSVETFLADGKTPNQYCKEQGYAGCILVENTIRDTYYNSQNKLCNAGINFVQTETTLNGPADCDTLFNNAFYGSNDPRTRRAECKNGGYGGSDFSTLYYINFLCA